MENMTMGMSKGRGVDRFSRDENLYIAIYSVMSVKAHKMYIGEKCPINNFWSTVKDRWSKQRQ